MHSKGSAILVLLSVLAILAACAPAGETTTSPGGAVVVGGEAARLAAQAAPAGYGGYTPGLTVVGTGTVQAQPDIVYLTLGVDLQTDNAAAVVADASVRMDRILAALQSAGVAEEDIRTASYNLWVQQRYEPITGQYTGAIDYHIMHAVRVTLRDMDRVGTVLATAVEAGANSVSEVTFSVADPDRLASEARAQAIADAQRRAREMAAALGVTLGKVVAVSESGGYAPMPTYYDGRGALPEYAAAVPLPAGSFSVSVSVVVVYELP